MVIFHTLKLLLLLFFFLCTTFLCLSSSSSISTRYYSILGPKMDTLPSRDESLQLFQQWMNDHGRVYQDLEETTKRFEIFLSNLKYITESNAKRVSPSSHLLGLNKFADWSPEEFQEVYLHDLGIPADNNNNNNNNDTKLNNDHLCCSPPSYVDWREKGAVTAVKDQGSCGSCWTFSATGAIEGINAIATGDLITLSEQELLDCDSVSDGCDGGWVNKAFDWVISNGGIALEADYPYKGKKDRCQSYKSPKSVTIEGYRHVARSDSGLLRATANQPVSVCLDATDFQFYHSGIFDGHNCPRNSTYSNHCVLIVGYDSKDGKDYWIVKNSWGEDWGENGYIWIKRNTDLPYGVCGINAWAHKPIKKSSIK